MDERKLKNFRTRLWLRGVIVVLGVVALVAFLLAMQTRAAELQQQKTGENTLGEVMQTLDTNAETVETLTADYHAMNRSMLASLRDLLEQGRLGTLLALPQSQQCAALAALRDTVSAELLVLTDAAGTVTLSGSEAALGQSMAALLAADADTAALFAAAPAQGAPPLYAALADGTMDGYFYSTPLVTEAGRFFLILGEDAAVLNGSLTELQVIGSTLATVGAGDDGFAFAADPATGTFCYYDDGAAVLTGSDYTAAGLQASALADGAAGVQTIGGRALYCVSRHYTSPVYGDVVLVAAMPLAALTRNREQVVGWAVIAFLLAAALLTAYTTILRNESLRSGQPPRRSRLWQWRGTAVYLNKTVGKKTLLLFSVGLVFVFGVSVYTQTLMSLVGALGRADAYMGEVSRVLAANTASAEAIRSYYSEEYGSMARLLAAILENTPELIYTADPDDESTHPRTTGRDAARLPVRDAYGNPVYSVANAPALQALCEHNLLDDLYVFNENAEVIAANNDLWYFTLSTDPDAQSYELRSVLDGKTDICVQDAQWSDRQELKQYAASVYYYYTYRAADGSTAYTTRQQYTASRAAGYDGPVITRHRGMVEIGVSPERLAAMYNLDTIDSILPNLRLDSESATFAIWPEQGDLVLCAANEADIGKTAAELGIGEEKLNGNYCGFARVDGENCFWRFARVGDYILATATPTAALYRARNGIALYTTLVSGLFLLLLTASLVLGTDATEEAYRCLYQHRSLRRRDRRFFTMRMPSGETKRVATAESRWDGLATRWGEKAPEQKLALILRGMEGLCVALIFAALLYGHNRADGSVLLDQLLGNAWGRGLNIFAFTACGALLVCISVFSWLLKRLLRTVAATLGARAETVGKLLESVISYGGLLAGLFYCLYLLGFDSGTLLASAGLLSLVVGLGAQSLIGDILAGMFIVFEGEFRVGDIVTIDGFCGQVLEIGLRTTKVENNARNIQIFSNSDVKKVLNMTKEASMATCDINLDYSVSYAQVEAICAAELPAIRTRCKEILEGPYLRGINSLNENGIEVSVGAQCNELDRGIVNRALRREMLEIFRRYGIKLALPRREVTYRATPTAPAPENPLLHIVQEAADEARAEGCDPVPPLADDKATLRALAEE